MPTIIQPLTQVGFWAEPPFGGIPASFNAPLRYQIGLGAFTGFQAPAKGEIFGLQIQGGQLITLGFADCLPTINGIPVGTAPFRVNTTNQIPALFRVTDANRFFQERDLLGIFAVGGVNLTPDPTAYLVFLTVIYNRGVSTDEQGI